MGTYTYLLLDLFTLSPVLFLSFDKWVRFHRKWIPALLSIIPIAVVFILWDVWFVDLGVWHFNPKYLVGFFIGVLPLEEHLFFLVVPWVCLFIYESLKYHFPFLLRFKHVQWGNLLILLAAVLMLFGYDGYYTVVNASLAVVSSLLILLFCSTNEKVYFMWMYLLHLIPFAFVNGVLTSYPVVIYNDTENMGIRIGSIPLDDFFYSYNLLALVFFLYSRINRLSFFRS